MPGFSQVRQKEVYCMIVFIRCDDRLIHGQVVTQWVNRSGANRIVIIETQNEQESKDVSGYISEAIHMRDICPAFFTPEDGDEYLELEGRVKWQDSTQLILRYDVFLKMYL